MGLEIAFGLLTVALALLIASVIMWWPCPHKKKRRRRPSCSSSSDECCPPPCPCPPPPPPPPPPSPSPPAPPSPTPSPAQPSPPGPSPAEPSPPSPSPAEPSPAEPSPPSPPSASPPGLSPPGLSPPNPSPPGPSPPESSPPQPPMLLGDVFGLSNTDHTVSAIDSGDNPPFPTDPTLANDFGGLTPSTVFIQGNPNTIPGTFTDDYRWVASISQAPPGTMSPARAGVLDITDPLNNMVISHADIPGTASDQVFTIVSTLGAAGASPAQSRVYVAVNHPTANTSPGSSFIGATIYRYDSTGTSGTFILTGQLTLAARGPVSDMRTSLDGSRVALTLLTTGADMSALPFPFNVVSFEAVDFTSGPIVFTNTLLAISPATDQSPVSLAWTTDSESFVVVTSHGSLTADHFLKYNAISGALTGSTQSGRAPAFISVKIIIFGTMYLVGHRGTDLMDLGSWVTMGAPGTQALGGDNTGVVDMVTNPALQPNGYAILYFSGLMVLMSNPSGSAAVTIVPPFSGRPPGTRISFTRDGFKLFIGHFSFGGPGVSNVVTEVDDFAPFDVHEVFGTDNQTFYVVTNSSANYSGPIETSSPGGLFFGLSFAAASEAAAVLATVSAVARTPSAMHLNSRATITEIKDSTKTASEHDGDGFFSADPDDNLDDDDDDDENGLPKTSTPDHRFLLSIKQRPDTTPPGMHSGTLEVLDTTTTSNKRKSQALIPNFSQNTPGAPDSDLFAVVSTSKTRVIVGVNGRGTAAKVSSLIAFDLQPDGSFMQTFRTNFFGPIHDMRTSMDSTRVLLGLRTSVDNVLILDAENFILGSLATAV